MARGVYTISETVQLLSSPKSMLVIQAPAGNPVLLRRLAVYQEDVTTMFMAGIDLMDVTGPFSPGIAWSSITPERTMPGDQASGSSVWVSTPPAGEPTYTTGEARAYLSGNGLLGWLWEPLDPNDYVEVAPGAIVGLKFENSPPQSNMNFLIEAMWREVG